MAFRLIRNFIKLESFSGIILITATVLALFFANSPWQTTYQTIFNSPLNFHYGTIIVHLNLLHGINDGLMSVFFFLVSLEIKRELVEGELNTFQKALLPAIAACGGMLLPAIIFIGLNYQHEDLMKGWAIPTATDIAFSLGILSLLGKRVPVSLKIFLTALAILDDLGAIVIIAVFYHHQVHLMPILFAFSCVIILLIVNYLQISLISIYLLVGIFLWYFITQAGIHSSIAGVLLGLTIPIKARGQSILGKLEHTLHPWVAYGILPIFAFANAGICFCNASDINLFSTLSLGVMCGLVFGKPLGILLFSYWGVKLKLVRLPSNANWRHIYGLALICGVGFTMSIFIAMLAFPNSMTLLYEAKLSVLIGSALSAVLGYLVLRMV